MPRTTLEPIVLIPTAQSPKQQHTEAQAISNIAVFVYDLIDRDGVTWVRDPSSDGEAGYGFLLRRDDAVVDVTMAGVGLSQIGFGRWTWAIETAQRRLQGEREF